MGRPLRVEYPGAFFHVTARGNDGRDLFETRHDIHKFQEYMETAVTRYALRIHSYCLMPNHYHILLQTVEGNLSEAMQYLNGAYTHCFNSQRKRAGHLFQGRFKAILIQADAHLVEASRYVHLNPVRVGMLARPEEYPWSSYRDFVGDRPAPSWLTTQQVLRSFGSSEEYRRYVEEMLHVRLYPSPLQGLRWAPLPGGAEVNETEVAPKDDAAAVPAQKRLIRSQKIDRIVEEVQKAFPDQRMAVKVCIYLAHRYSGASLRSLGEFFQKKESAICQTSRRLVNAMSEDRRLATTVKDIEQRLRLSSAP